LSVLIIIIIIITHIIIIIITSYWVYPGRLERPKNGDELPRNGPGPSAHSSSSIIIIIVVVITKCDMTTISNTMCSHKMRQ